jgi:hypothetical protein
MMPHIVFILFVSQRIEDSLIELNRMIKEIMRSDDESNRKKDVSSCYKDIQITITSSSDNAMKICVFVKVV